LTALLLVTFACIKSKKFRLLYQTATSRDTKKDDQSNIEMSILKPVKREEQ
jgi:hypothetical protein